MSAAATGKKAPTEVKDSYREVVETVVFVVVLVLLLKTFVAEAFVIPTGSMAETLWGYQKVVVCPQCQFKFPVNCSYEIEEKPPIPVTGCTCPNCSNTILFTQEFTGRLLAVIPADGGTLIEVEPSSSAADQMARQGHEYRLDPRAPISIDGADAKLTALKPGMKLRALVGIDLNRDSKPVMTDIEAIEKTSSFPKKHKPLEPTCNTGDRVLVAKFLNDSGLVPLKPFDTVVFKFPEEPQQNMMPMNYIKRLIGFGSQTIGVYYGDLYVANLDYSKLHELEKLANELQERPATAEELDEERRQQQRQDEHEEQAPLRRRLHRNNIIAAKLLKAARRPPAGQEPIFQLLRKSADKILSLQRSVYDNDHPATDLDALQYPPRWAPEEGTGVDFREGRRQASTAWASAGDHGFRHAAHDGGMAWVRYRHLPVRRGSDSTPIAPDQVRPELITDALGYNSGISTRGAQSSFNWVGDLILELAVTVEEARGELVLELSKGIDRFQARFQLDTGVCTLVRLTSGGPKTLESHATRLSKPGVYHLRFANVDERLTVWVDRDLPFGDGAAYATPVERRQGGTELLWRGPSETNDLEPASIGVDTGSVQIDHLKLWRDTYYTLGSNADGFSGLFDNPSQWERLRELPPLTMYVQPGHYLCMGDNSAASSDSRSWAPRNAIQGGGGLVPQELMLGRALMIYYPFYCPVWPLDTPVQRVGLIR